MQHTTKSKTVKELRNFGFVMAGAFGTISAILWWKESSVWQVLGFIAAAFGVLAVVYPPLLRPIEFVWMKFALVMGAIMTRVILTLVFVIAVTPIGLLMRLFGKDPMRLKKPDGDSFWIPADKDGTAARHDKPF